MTPAEIAARAIRRNKFERTGRLNAFDPDIQPTKEELGETTAALAALERQGWVVVPKEPTPEMLDALKSECIQTWGANGKTPQKHIPINSKHEWRERMKPFYRAMLATRPAFAEGE